MERNESDNSLRSTITDANWVYFQETIVDGIVAPKKPVRRKVTPGAETVHLVHAAISSPSERWLKRIAGLLTVVCIILTGTLLAQCTTSISIRDLPTKERASTTEKPMTPFQREIKGSLSKLHQRFGLRPGDRAIVVDPRKQRLYLLQDGEVLKAYPVSTSKYGLGNRRGSGRTPFGTHRIVTKVGGGARKGTVFQSLRNTGRTAPISTDRRRSRAYMTSRILRLSGQEPRVNNGGRVDTLRRRIYIHGTAHEMHIGKPVSHGCIRMRNNDVIELYLLVSIGTLVEILQT